MGIYSGFEIESLDLGPSHAAGLGIGAMYIRSLTVYLVRKGTLDEFIHLEHGAHYAIGALAVILGISVKFEVPEVFTGLIGVGFIGAALASSIVARKRHREDADNNEVEMEAVTEVPAQK